MYPVSDKYKAAIQDSTRHFYYAGEIITKGGIRYPFTNEDIVKGSGYITNQCCGESEIELGSVYAAELGITLYSDVDRYTLEGADIRVSFFLMIDDGDFEEVPMGIFEISEANRTINCIAIKAYDYMLRFDKDFKNTVSSGTAYEILYLACEKCKVELAHTKEEMEGWENGSQLLGIYSENDIETWRDVLYYVAQVLGRFCTINREGKLELRQYGDKSVANIPGTQRFTSSFSDFVTRYTAISSTNSRTQTAEYYALEPDDGLTMNLGVNPMLQYGLDQTRKNLLLNILNDVSRIRYVPFDSSTIGNPAFDLGDIITFSGGHADGEQITCITKYEFKINGKHTLKCVGKNPRLSQAKSKNDKNIVGLMNSVEAGKIAVHTYMNASAYIIGSTDTEIADIEFASNEDTDAQFHGSILLNISADPVTKSGTARGAVSIPDGTGEMVDQDEEFSIEWTDDGQAVITVSYIINDSRLTTYVPVETWHSGRHILNLYYPINGLEANSYNTFRVLIHITGGSATVDRGQAVCTISGQGLSSNQNWDGRLEFYDDAPAIPNAGIMPLSNMLDRVNVHTENPDQNGYHDEFALPGFVGFGLVGFGEQISVEQDMDTEESE
ncbi:MAG: hypothetical protein K2K21_05990 [Lachnospiraceae bacterium]|nr:hypothetical protein [Lachnospiraceae bacterium]